MITQKFFEIHVTRIYDSLGECNSDWRSSDDKTCADYQESGFCTETGEYGPGWDYQSQQTFYEWQNDSGETALVCPECGCRTEEDPTDSVDPGRQNK